MRIIVLTLLLVVQSISVQSQTMEDEEFITFRELQENDFDTLRSLRILTDSITEKYDTLSQVDFFERQILQLNMEATLALIATMRDRERTMFYAVEENYQRFCLQAVPDPISCAKYTRTYRRLIADTLMLGGIYYRITFDSHHMMMSLNK